MKKIAGSMLHHASSSAKTYLKNTANERLFSREDYSSFGFENFTI
ncbi:MAG TPA: hypothetical protein VHB70_10410 [Parafilimonas sp.]|nr:hypothetical protein [Parafilimonas sp.]